MATRPKPAARHPAELRSRRPTATCDDATLAPQPVAAGGRLVLVVGPSGAGKDALINAARRKFASAPAFAFPRRILTRPDAGAEGHVAVGRRTFAALEAAGAFMFAWEAQGVRYALPAAVHGELTAGRICVANVWREAIPKAMLCWPGVIVVEVAVGPEMVRASLRQQLLRHRGATGHAEAGELAGPADYQLTHCRDLEAAVRQFCALLTTLSPPPIVAEPPKPATRQRGARRLRQPEPRSCGVVNA